MRRSGRLLSIACGLFLILPVAAQAATFSWSNVGTDWGAAANWGGAVPGPLDVALFDLPGYSFQPNIGEGNVVGGIWNTGTGPLNVSGAFPLTLNGTAINGNAGFGVEMDPGTGPMTVSAPIVLGGSQSWFNNSSSPLTTVGPINIFANTLTLSGGGPTSIAAPITGAGNLIVAPGASVTLSTSSVSTVNSYLGATQINGGLLTLQGPATGATVLPPSSAVSLSSAGTLNLNGVNSSIGSLGSSDPTTQVQLGTATLTTGGNNSSTAFTGSIGGAGGVTKAGGGTFTLSGSNTYGGATSVSSGVLQISGGSALPAGSQVLLGSATLSLLNDGTGSGGTVSPGNNITLSLATASDTINVGDLSTSNANNTVAFGVLSNGTTANALSSTINFTASNGYKQSFTGLNLPGSSGQSTVLNPTTTTVLINGPVKNQMTALATGFDTLFLGGSSVGNAITGIISDASGYPGPAGSTPVTSNGTGQWILSGSNTYHGGTTLSSGSLEFAGNGALPAATAISFNTTNIAALQVRNDGTGSGSTVNLGNNITLTAATTTAIIDVGSLSGTANNVTVSFGTLANGVAVQAVQAGGFNFTGNNGYIASFTKLLLAGSSGANTFLLPTTANVVIGSPATISATNVVNQEDTAGGFDSAILNGTSAGNNGLGNVIYGAIADRTGYVPNNAFLQGETNLTVCGSGNGILPTGVNGNALWTLAGSETYHGWTLINSGTLQLGTGQAGQDGVLYAASPGGTCSITSNAGYSDVRDQGTLIFNNVGNYTINYSVSGAGTLVKLGPGLITLTGATGAGNAYTGQTTIGGGTLQIGAGGATGAITSSSGIVDNGVLSFNQSNAVGYGNAVSGSGAIYQIGSGTTTVSSASNFSGSTSVTNGTLILSGTNRTSAISVAAGATLGGSFAAPSAGAAIANTGTLIIGSGTTGSVTLGGGLTFTGGGTINAGSIGNYYASTGTAAAVNVGGSLSAGGAVTLKLSGAGPAVLGGNYQVLGYGGGLSGAGSNSFVLNTAGMSPAPTNFSPTIVYSGSAVDVNFGVSNYPIWTGSVSTAWDTSTANWQNSSAGGSVTFASNNLAYFGDTAGTISVVNFTVSISSTVAPYSAYFANNTAAYTLGSTAGSNGIVGTAMLVMNGAGSLTVNSTNTYTGGTFLYNGTLSLGNSAALGAAAGTLTLAGGTLNNTSGAAMTLPNYPIVLGGNVGFLGSNPLNLGAGAVTLAANSTLNVTASTLTVGGAISGPYGLTETGAGVLLFNAADTYTGATLVSGGTLALGSANSLQNSTLGISGAGIIYFGSLTSATVGGLTNGGSLNLTNGTGGAVTLSVGNNNLNNASSAAISGSGGITKIGSGIQTLSGNNTYAGATNVSAGTLQSQGANGLPSGGAIGMGGGTFSIANDGSGSSGTISLGNNITLTAGATVGIDVRGLTGSTSSNTVSFGVLSNGTSANAFSSTINFTGANGYVHSYAGLGLSGLTGQGTTLNPTTTTVIINGPVTNQESGTTSGHFDTLTLGGSSLGNEILGTISDSYSYSSVGNGDTRVTKTGASQWILGGANTYHGPTAINGGTLALGPNGSISSLTISIASNATFDVSALTSGFTLQNSQTMSAAGNATVNGSMALASGAALLPGGLSANSSGTLNVGNLSINAGSVLGYELSPSSLRDLINVANLTIHGGGINLYDTSGTNQFATPGTYPIMAYSGSLGGSVANLSVLNPVANSLYAYSFSASGSMVDVTIQAANGWTGGSGGPAFNWSKGANWLSGLAPSGGSAILFAGTTGLTNSNDISGLNLPGFTFAASAGAFNITGNSIQLSGPVVNSSTAAQTIGLAMQLTGGNQTITAASGNIVLAGVLSDGGSGNGITTGGANTVVLSAANTFSGPTTIAGGSLDLANGMALQNSTVTLSGGSLTFDPSVPGAAFTLGGLSGGNNINLAANVTGYPTALSIGNNGATTTYSGVMSGPGSLTKAGSGTLYLSGANTFTGNTQVAGGVLQLANASALQNSTLDTSGAGQINFGSLTAATVGGLINGGSLFLQNNAGSPVTLSVGNNGVSNISSATIGGSGGITKVGAGLQALSGNNTYSGGTNISAGTLQFQGGGALPSGGTIGMAAGGSPALSIANDGSGSGGTISPGNSITLTSAGAATIDVRNNGFNSGSTNSGNLVVFGTLSNGTSANAFGSTINFTGANGYVESFAGLNLPGSSGQTTTLVPLSTTVLINGPVNNVLTTTGTTTNYDTLVLDGLTTGNTIFGVIADSAVYTAVNHGDTRLTKQNASQWILANQETYHGPTSVAGGTLQLGTGMAGQDGALYTGTAPNPSGVSVGSGATLAYMLSPSAGGLGNVPYVISGSGAVTILSGQVTYGTPETYFGPTTITGGTLALGAASSINSTTKITLGNGAGLDVSQVSPWTLRSGQTLGGTGAYLVNGTVTNAAGSVIQPGTLAANSAGTLNVGGLTLGGGTLSYEMGSNQDLVDVTGINGLTIDSATAINFYDTSGTNSFGTPGTYPFMAYNGTLGGTLANLTVGNPNLNATYTFSTSAGFVDLNVTTGHGWNGGGGSPFDWSNSGNWSSGVAIASGESANFQGTTGLTNVNDLAGLNLTGIVFAANAGAFNLTGNSIQLSGAISNSSTATQTIGLNMLLAGNESINAAAGNIVLGGVLSDGGLGYGIIVNGPGAVALGGANTYTGNTAVNSGTLSLANDLAALNSTVSLGSGSVLTFAAGITAPSLGGLAGSGNIALVTAASEAVALNVGGNGQNTTYSGVMSGAGGLVKVGGGTLTFAAATTNSYSGATLITDGVLQASRANVMSPNSAVAISNGSTFNMTNSTQTIASLSSTDGMGSQVLLGSSGRLVVAGPGVTTFDGVISGAGGAMTLLGGTLMLTNQNTFSGATTVSGGVLQLNSTAGPALAGNLAVSGGTAVWLQNSQVSSAANLSVSAGLANIGLYSNAFNNVQTTGGTIAGTTGTITSNNAVDARSGTINAVLAGGAGLNKTTAGTVVLGAANTYSGNTNVSAGRLTLANPLAVQNSTVNMNGGVLGFVGGNTSPSLGGLTGYSNLPLATAAAEPVALNVGSNGQATTYSGIMSGIGGLVKQGVGTFALGANQAYSGATVVSSGVLQLGPVTPLVPLTVSNFGSNTSGANGSNTTWTVNNNGGLTTAITNNVLTLTVDEGVAESRSAFYNTPVPVGAFSATFVYQESTGYTYPTDGATFVLQNASSGVSALGGGAQGLGYTGITPSAGMGVDVYYSNPYGANQLLWLKGGAVVSNSATAPVSPTNGSPGHPILMTLNYDGSNSMTTTWTDLTTSATYSASYAIGNLATVLGGNSAYIGFTGASATLDTGVFAGYATQTIGSFSYTYTGAGAPIAGTNVLPASTPLVVSAAASVDLYGGNDAVGSLAGPGTVTNSVAGSLAVLTVGNSATTQTFSGVLQDGAGSLGLGVVAPGGLVLTGQNTYSGPTTISSGTLQLGNGQSGNDGTITGAGGVNDNGLLVYNLFGSQTPAYAIAGSGAVTKTGPGTLTLADGNNSYGGGTNVLQGLLVIAPGSFALPYGPLNVSGGSLDLEGNTSVVSTLTGNGTIGNGALGVANSATLYVEAGGHFSGIIRDGGFGGNAPLGLELDGGALVLSGTDTFSAGTVVTGGTLVLGSPTALAAGSSLTVGAGASSLFAPASAGPAAAAVVASVPEPGTMALLAAGLAIGIGIARRRRMRKSK
jgi:fibronectin-binding autotransporter adhesin